MSLERITVNLPEGFDPVSHQGRLLSAIAKAHGEGFEIDTINVEERVAVATRQAVFTEVDASEKKVFLVRLAKDTRKSDGDRIAIRLQDQYEGYTLTKFEPHLGRAEMAKLNRATVRARGAVSNALGCKPWEVEIKVRGGGGWHVAMPDSYVPSRHDEKLEEVATQVVGQVGWRAIVDAQELTCELIPGEPPTFPAAVPYPFDRDVVTFSPDQPQWGAIPIGVKLPESADDPLEPICIDFAVSPHGGLTGISGAGKSATLNAMVTGMLAAGSELVIVDLKSKSVDFEWCKPLVRDGGWGCDGLASSVTTLGLAYAEGERRAELIAKYKVTKWTELPVDLGLRPVFIVVDELTGLLAQEKVPRGLDKEHPARVEVETNNALRSMIEFYIGKIAAEMRFAGLNLLLSSQVMSSSTSISTAIRLNLGSRALLGAKPTKNNRGVSLSNPTAVPYVPEHVAEDDAAARGVGVSEFEGQVPSVFKGYWASTADYRAWLESRNVPHTSRPSVTADEIDRYAMVSPVEVTNAAPEADSEDADDLPARTAATPAEGAAPSKKMCPSCGTPIDSSTGECACSR